MSFTVLMFAPHLFFPRETRLLDSKILLLETVQGKGILDFRFDAVRLSFPVRISARSEKGKLDAQTARCTPTSTTAICPQLT